MPKIETNSQEIGNLAPYNQKCTCPKCRAGFWIVPGDRFEALPTTATAPDQPDGIVRMLCPGCLSVVDLPWVGIDRVLDSVIQIPFVEYDDLKRAADLGRKVERLLNQDSDLNELSGWLEAQFIALRRQIGGLEERRPVEPQPRRPPREDYDEQPPYPIERRRQRFGPRGRVDLEAEEALTGGTVKLGGSSGRRGSQLGEYDGPSDDQD